MGSDTANRGELVPVDESAQNSTDSSQLELFDQFVKIERDRIQSQNNRTEVALRAVEVSDASDKRQFEFHVKKLDSEERQTMRRLSFGFWITAGVGAVISIFLLVLLYMMFFGTEIQASRGQNLLGAVFTAVGGGGLLILGQRALGQLMNKRSK